MEGDVRALGGERERDRAAESLPGADDEHDLVREPEVHGQESVP